MSSASTQSAPIESAEPNVVVRGPSLADGAAMWELVRSTEVLELNTCYAYLLLSTHFADTCLVAEAGGQIVGFVAAYRPPTQPRAIFVWQIAVSEEARGQGLGKRLLNELIDLPACADVTHLTATVTPSNQPSVRLFTSFARERGVWCERAPGLAATDFGPLEHEAEELFQIGPLRRNT
ncbi:MAG: L-2,4-diaminobutyric acid acetyltransferase [Polyangiales bacterium]|jgi:L-2,4-diaminobutyric acid acetyltransferase